MKRMTKMGEGGIALVMRFDFLDFCWASVFLLSFTLDSLMNGRSCKARLWDNRAEGRVMSWIISAT